MRILGVDPGSRKTGWGIVELVGRKIHHIDHGVLFLNTELDLPGRLAELASKLLAVVEKFAPQKSAIEEVFYSKNAKSALILGQARGAILGVLGLQQVAVMSLSPAEVKLSVAGSGRASKEQIQAMVTSLLSLKETPFEDASDALAVAIASTKNILAPQFITAHVKKTPRGAARKSFEDLARLQNKI